MPRTHATICGAPKAIAIPRIAPIHQPQDMRFAIAMAPSAITRMTAIGVSQARMLVCRAVAPVMNGELCASAGIGEEPTSNAARAHQGSVERIDAKRMAASLRLAHAARARGHTRRGLPAPRLELLPLRGTRGSEAEAVHDKGVVVLLLALLVGPVVGSHPRLDDELIALARIAGDRLTQRPERDEPQAGDDLARGTLFALAGVVVAHQAEARVAGLVLGCRFRVAGEIADRGQREAVHRDGSLLPSVGPGGSAVSLFTRPMIGIAIRRVFVQKCSTGCAGVARSGPCSCMVAARDSQQGVAAMSLAHTRSDATVEECLDELNDIIMGLQSYPPTVLAVALRVHLSTLLQALLEGQLCSREDVRDFVRELERDALQYDED